MLKRFYDVDTSAYHLHINFPGGTPIDGPSAGTAIITAVYSAICNLPVSNRIAMTGEISIHGKVKPVGGVAAKVAAALEEGVQTVFVPKENYRDLFHFENIEVVPVENVSDIFDRLFDLSPSILETPVHHGITIGPLSAQSADNPVTQMASKSE